MLRFRTLAVPAPHKVDEPDPVPVWRSLALPEAFNGRVEIRCRSRSEAGYDLRTMRLIDHEAQPAIIGYAGKLDGQRRTRKPPLTCEGERARIPYERAPSKKYNFHLAIFQQ